METLQKYLQEVDARFFRDSMKLGWKSCDKKDYWLAIQCFKDALGVATCGDARFEAQNALDYATAKHKLGY